MTTLIRQLKDLRQHPYAWPGGYPLYAVATDGGALCAACVRDEWRLIATATHEGDRSGWAVAGIDINWEDTDLHCDNCGEKIESAYGDA